MAVGSWMAEGSMDVGCFGAVSAVAVLRFCVCLLPDVARRRWVGGVERPLSGAGWRWLAALSVAGLFFASAVTSRHTEPAATDNVPVLWPLCLRPSLP